MALFQLPPTTRYNCLPFDTERGRVEAYDLIRHNPEWLKGDPIKQVVIDIIHDRALNMRYEVHLHWTNWIEYERKTWPGGHSVSAVITESGRRIHAEALSVGHSNESYLRAPLIARDHFVVAGLGSRTPLIEVAGVYDYIRGIHRGGDPEALAEKLAREATYHPETQARLTRERLEQVARERAVLA